MTRNRLVASEAKITLWGNKCDWTYKVRRLVPAIQKLFRKICFFFNISSIPEMSVK